MKIRLTFFCLTLKIKIKMPKQTNIEKIAAGKSEAQVFLEWLRDQHQYFRLVTNESAKMYADRFAEVIAKEKAEAEKTISPTE